jgi:hypothetical protein
MERTCIAAALAALTMDVAACATHHGSSAPPAPERAAVTVKNDNWSDVVVFVVRSGTRSRIGSVTAMSTHTFRVPPDLAPDGILQLMVDPVGSNNTYVTDRIVVNSGQRVELTVAQVLRMSSFSVWAR